MKHGLRMAVAAWLFAAAHSSRAALTDNLVGLYQFQNNFLDTSGSPQPSHGTPVNNPGFTAGKIGQAMSLTGTRDYMSLNPTALAELDFGSTTAGDAVDFSASMWIRQDNFLSDPAVLSNKDWDSGANTGINWAVNGNGIFDLNTKGDVGARRDLDTAANSAQLPVGQWNLVVMTVDRDGPTRLYINGVNTGTIPLSSQGDFNGGLPWNIGQDGVGDYGVEFTGAVDELAFWRRALSPAEASSLWNGGAGINLGATTVESRLKITVDRDSGKLTLVNKTGVPQDLIAYQITSAAGTFNRGGWTPIAGRLDAAGNKSVDADDNWVVLTAANSVSDLSEASLGAGTIPSGATVDLGAGVWQKYFEDFNDVTFQYANSTNDEPISGLVEFVGGHSSAFAFGDLDFDGDLDSDDWATLARGFNSSLAGSSTAQRYRLSDLNNDAAHNLDDILAFRQAFDAANGVGAFAAMTANVPEPAGHMLVALGAVAIATLVRRRPLACRWAAAAVVAVVGMTWQPPATYAGVLFQQNFDGVALGPSVDETPAAPNVWTPTPPAGWSVDNSGVPPGGVTEWRGWSFVSPTWWSTVAQDQGRSEFTKASGAIAVADPDEWDDLPRTAGTYNSLLKTPAISLAGVAANTARLRFDSSWLPEDTQTATVSVSYNGGSDVSVLRWTSASGDPNFKAGATNETVEAPLNNPAGATTMTLKFGMVNAENDWWWAIDNVRVFTPLTLQVDVQSGAMKLLGDAAAAITGYEIDSPGGSLGAAGWRAGNLDAQNVGVPLPHRADFNHNGAVDAGDLATWRTGFGSGAGSDADADGDTDGVDFLRWQSNLGATSDAASTWQTFLATDKQLIESYLFGSSTFAADRALGAGYNQNKDLRDLVFSYTTLAGEKMTGAVNYVNVPPASSVPEPLGAAIGGWICVCRRRSRVDGRKNRRVPSASMKSL